MLLTNVYLHVLSLTIQTTSLYHLPPVLLCPSSSRSFLASFYFCCSPDPPATPSQLRSIKLKSWLLRLLQSCSLGMMAGRPACLSACLRCVSPAGCFVSTTCCGEGKQFAATSTISPFSEPAGSIFEISRWHLAAGCCSHRHD